MVTVVVLAFLSFGFTASVGVGSRSTVAVAPFAALAYDDSVTSVRSECKLCVENPLDDTHYFTNLYCDDEANCYVCDEFTSDGCHEEVMRGLCGVHLLCDQSRLSPEDMEALVAAIQGDDANFVSRMLRRYPKALLVNEQRGMIQWLDCKGSVWAQMPLSERLAAGL